MGVNLLDLSDEEFAEKEQSILDDIESTTNVASNEEHEQNANIETSETLTDDEVSTEEEISTDVADATDVEENTEEDLESLLKSSSKEDKDTEEKEETEDLVKQELQTNINSFFEKVTAPFKANGQTVKIDNPDDVIQLMRFGMDYTKKMQEFATHRKTIKALTDNGIQSDDQVNFVIDLLKHKPEAIKKLISDASIDVIDLAGDIDDNGSKYVASNYVLSNQQLDLEDTIEELKTSQLGVTAISTIENSWDKQSMDAVRQQPIILKQVYDAMESGMYQQISTEIDRRKMLGRLRPDTPFLEAYNMIVNEKSQIQQPQVQQPIERKSKQTNQVDERTKHTKANSSAKPTGKKKLDIMNMSDEDFLKHQSELEKIISKY